MPLFALAQHVQWLKLSDTLEKHQGDMKMRNLSMFVGLVAILTVTAACGSDGSPTAEFRSALDRSQKLADEVIADDLIVTDQILSQVLAPLETATPAVLNLVQQLKNPDADLLAIRRELVTLNGTEQEIHALMQKLGVERAAYARSPSAEDIAEFEIDQANYNTCSSGSGSSCGSGCGSGSGSGSGYYLRWGCYALVTAATAGGAYLCPVTGPFVAACLAAVATGAGAGLQECDRIQCWAE
jgi:hypothetical protein